MPMATLQLVRLRGVQPHATNPGAVPMQSARWALRMHLPSASSLCRPVHPWGGLQLGGCTWRREFLDPLRVPHRPLLKAKVSRLQVPTASISTLVQKVEFVAHEVKKAVLPVISVAALFLIRICVALKECPPPLMHSVPAVAMMAIAVWGLTPIMRSMRRVVLKKVDTDWENSGTETITNSYIRPLLLWAGVIIICRASDPIIMWSEASQEIKQRFVNFVRSLSTVLAFAFCTSSLTQQVKKSMMDCNLLEEPRNMSVQFIGNAVYTSVWVAAACLFMELLGFSTQKWLAAGGFGTVLLTLAGREIFTNFLSSMMIHATKPFVESEWIQTKIDGQEVSGTVEHVGWWSPTVVRGDDREAVHIPNHKFSVSVVRNLTQKTHWRIKTHIGISHLDVNKLNGIVSDMRKVLTKHPQVEQQRLHRRVFFDQINPENQALLILVSCFVKTSHFEEYLRVKEAILLDLLKVISHYNARLATPIRSMLRVKEEGEAQVASANSTQTRLFMLKGALTKENSDLDENDTVSRDLDQTKRPLKDSTPRKRDMFTVATDTKEKCDHKSKVSANEKTLASHEPMPSSSISKSPLEGIESLGLKSKDITLLGAAFGKPPAKFHEGSIVQDNEKPPINAADSSIEGDKKKMVVAHLPGQSKGSQSKGPILERGVNMRARDSKEAAQENVRKNPVGTGAPPDVNQKDIRKEQGQREDSRPQSGHRMQGGEENLVLGVALNGHRRTLSLEDLTKFEIAPTGELRDLVGTWSGTSNTGIKDRKDVAATQPDLLPGSVPDGKGQAK